MHSQSISFYRIDYKR